MPVYKESHDERTFKQNIDSLKDAVYLQAPKLQRAGQYGAEEKKAVETAKQLIKIGESVHDSREKLMQARADLAAGKSERKDEVFAGATSMFVGAVAYTATSLVEQVGAPTNETRQDKRDAADTFSRGVEYIDGAQTAAYKTIQEDIRSVEKAANEFYATFNATWDGILEGKPEAQQKLVAAVEKLQAAWSKLDSDMIHYKANAAEFVGVVGLSKEFAQDAAKEVAIALAMAKGLEIAFKVAEPLIVKGAEKVISWTSSSGKVAETAAAATQVAEVGAEGAVITARVVGTAARVEEAAVIAGRVKNTTALAGKGVQYAEKGLHTAHNAEVLHAAGEKEDAAAHAEVEGVSIAPSQTVFVYAGM